VGGGGEEGEGLEEPEGRRREGGGRSVSVCVEDKMFAL